MAMLNLRKFLSRFSEKCGQEKFNSGSDGVKDRTAISKSPSHGRSELFPGPGVGIFFACRDRYNRFFEDPAPLPWV